MYQIILASESPRRKEIMELMEIPFLALAANVEEIVEETRPDEMVMALAELKTNAVSQRKELESGEYEDLILIGADTMVFYQEQALGKPKDEADAIRMLQLLSDASHEVYTGVHIIIRNKNRQERISFAVATKVTVFPLKPEQIKAYVETGEPMDKAGAYAIQGKFGIYIKEMIGEYYNVVGFPIASIYEALLKRGIDLKNLK